MQRVPSIRIVDTQLETLDCSTRLPFRFGIHTLTGAPYATATVVVETSDGVRGRGAASDLLVPKWFQKDASMTPQEDSAALVASAEAAFKVALSLPAGTTFGLWRGLYQERVASQPRQNPDLLVRGFGVALLERAMMDAVCRLEGCSFHSALSTGLFGFRPAEIHSELEGWNLAEELPPQPAQKIHLRHTVGLLDALTDQDLDPDFAPDDGFPNTLEQDVRTYGLRYFKIKVAGRGQEDVDRLLEVSRVLSQCGVDRPRITIDGNEQFADMAQMAELLAKVHADPDGKNFLLSLELIEQPLSRDHTFDPDRNAELKAVSEYAPVIIDEADFGTWSFPDAIELGYQGISIKACKGVFRALLNRGICSRRGGALFQSGEDLTNLPVRALQQDLCLMATLGIKHVERNGHHYFRGLDHLPSLEAEEALRAHPDLYHQAADSIALAVHEGQLSIASLNSAGFGCRLDP